MIRNTLRIRRAEKGINQVETAILNGIGTARYWRIEKGYQPASPEEQQRLADFFEVSVDVLFPPVPQESHA